MKKVIEKCKKAEVYMYLIPSMVIFSIFLFYPFFKTIYLSLYKTNKLGEAKLYVGLDNYKSLLSNPSFYNSLWVTLEFVAIVVWRLAFWEQFFAARLSRESGYSVLPMHSQWQ